MEERGGVKDRERERQSDMRGLISHLQGKGRAWIRLALIEKKLGYYVQLLTKNAKVRKKPSLR